MVSEQEDRIVEDVRLQDTIIVMEELAEVLLEISQIQHGIGKAIIACSKILRFGPGNYLPSFGDNTDNLARELGDLLGILDHITFTQEQRELIDKHRAAKYLKVERLREENKIRRMTSVSNQE